MSSIQPFDKTIIQTIVRFSLDITKLILNESATFTVSLYDVNDIVIDRQFVSIEGTDYVNWGNDDSYIIRFVANQLGFVMD